MEKTQLQILNEKYESVLKEIERLKAIVNKFKFQGTDGCASCETGRIQLYYTNAQCMTCNPESYEVEK